MRPLAVFNVILSPRSAALLPVLCLAFGGLSSIMAYHSEDTDWERARNSIRGPWYDNEQKSFVPPDFEAIEDHPVRQEGRPAGPDWDWQRPNWNLGWLANWVTYIVITVICLVLLACLVLLLMHFVRSSSRFEDRRAAKSIEIDLTRVEDLPFTVEQMAGDPLTQARHLADSGRYDSAIIYLYGYFLLALDQSRKIHLQKGKTNRMYLRELSPFLDLQAVVERTMLRFEEVYFGKHSISQEEFDESWASLDIFHRLLPGQSTKSAVDSHDSVLVGEAMS